MSRSKFDALSLIDQLSILGNLKEPEPGLCAAIEHRVMDMLRGGQLQEIADACSLHQAIQCLTSLDSKVDWIGEVYEVEQLRKWPDKFTWHFPEINPIRRLHELGEHDVIKPLSKFFTGFTPSGMVIGTPPSEYGKRLESIYAGSALTAIAAEGEGALFFSKVAKKAFNDVIKLYGKDVSWRHSKPLINLMNSDKAPLQNMAIWSGEFTSANDYLLDSLEFVPKLAKRLYDGDSIHVVVADYLQGAASNGSNSRLAFWFKNLQKDSGQVPTLQRSVLQLFETVSEDPGLFMNESYMNLHLALSHISEAVIPGSKDKTLYGLVMGQLGMSVTFNGAYRMYCDLASTIIDRGSFIQGLDATQTKKLHGKLEWEECLPKLGLKHRGKIFADDLGL